MVEFSPLLEGSLAQNSNPLITRLIYLVTSLLLKLPGSSPWVTLLEYKRHFYH